MTQTRLRGAALAVLCLLAGGQIIRNLGASMPRESRPDWLGATWSGHPQIMGEELMASVGNSARAGSGVSGMLAAKSRELARRAPLDPQPYLVAGASAEKSQQGDKAERLFVMARLRDPRSGAARYFLANRFLRTGRVGDGLEEMAATSRLVPGTAGMAPAFAEFAATSGYTRELHAFLNRHPEFRDPVLNNLAGDASHVSLVLRLAGSKKREAVPSPDWRETLVTTLIKAGHYDEARKIWGSLAGVGTETDLFNPSFQPNGPPPPFNWRLEQGTAGLIEPRKGGGLEIVYYGRADAVFATQTLTLAPGTFRLGATVAATSLQTGLAWVVACLPSGNVISRLPIERQGAGPVATSFAVPSNCGAQTLSLVATDQDLARTIEVTLTDFSLRRSTL